MSFGGGGGGAAPEEMSDAQVQLAQMMADVGDELMDEYRWGTQPYQEAATTAAYSLLGPNLGLARARATSDARNIAWGDTLTDASALTDLQDVNFYNTDVRPYQKRLLDDSAHILDIMRPNWDLTAQNIGIGLQGMQEDVKKLDPEGAAAKAVADVVSEFDKSAGIQESRLASFGLNPASPRFQFLQTQNSLDRAKSAVAMGSQARDREQEKQWSRYGQMAGLTPPQPLVGSNAFGIKPTVRMPGAATINGLSPSGVTPDQVLAAYKTAMSGYDSAGSMSKSSQQDTSGQDAAAMMGAMASMVGAAASFS